MEIEIQFTDRPIAETILPPGQPGAVGAWLEFRGVVRGEENGQTICALEYEAYPEMAGREIRRLLQDISERHPCRAAKVIHRVGVIPVGETAIYVGVVSPHRGEAIALLAEFMDRLKQDVPIWKRRATADKHRRRRRKESHSLRNKIRDSSRRLLQIVRRSAGRNPFPQPAVARRSRAVGGGAGARLARNDLCAGRFAAGGPLDARRLRDPRR